MFSRSLKKQNKFKRFLLKLLNVYAYDKETLNIINPYYENNSGNFFDFNNKSFNFSKGYLDLTRNIKKLDIFFRYSPNNNLWNSTTRWKRIVPNIDKKILISVCLISLRESILNFTNQNKIKIDIHLISDNSDDSFDNKIINMLKSDSFNVIKHNTKISGNRGSYLECCDQADKSEDLILFVEDDYLFEPQCIDEILSSFSKISSLLKQDVILCPSDYPFFYDSLFQTSLLIGKEYKWRIVRETLLTILFSKDILIKHRQLIRKVGNTINEPFEKPLHEVYKKDYCLAPINTLCHHLSRSVPSIHENWKNTWDKNYAIYKKI